jgi:hypothetical protein
MIGSRSGEKTPKDSTLQAFPVVLQWRVVSRDTKIAASTH